MWGVPITTTNGRLTTLVAELGTQPDSGLRMITHIRQVRTVEGAARQHVVSAPEFWKGCFVAYYFAYRYKRKITINLRLYYIHLFTHMQCTERSVILSYDRGIIEPRSQSVSHFTAWLLMHTETGRSSCIRPANAMYPRHVLFVPSPLSLRGPSQVNWHELSVSVSYIDYV